MQRTNNKHNNNILT